MKKFYLLALVAAMFAACATDATEDVAIGVPETLRVSLEEEDSRIQLANGKTVWTKGDQVSVFYRSNANQKWQYKGETGERVGELQQVDAGSATREMDRVVVVYPYNESYYINPSTCNVQASLPAVQTYLADSYGLNGNIMISHGEYNNISLKSVCGWLKLQLTGNGEKVQSITLRGNNGEQVAGEIYINSADATAILSSDAGNADDGELGSAGGNLLFEETILKEVALNCGEGVELGTEPTAFYIALPPQTFEKGLTVDIDCKGYKPMYISTSNAISIERNHIQPMANVAISEARTIANNEIWYTSCDGCIVKPHNEDKLSGFNGQIISNTYSNGWGVIVFDVDLTSIGYRAFSSCRNLKSIIIPDSVRDIGMVGGYTFAGCDKLEAFYGKFASKDHRCLIIGSHLESFAPAGLIEYTIPEGVYSIGEAFRYCANIENIIIPNSVHEIDSYAFSDCISLKNIIIPENVSFIRDCTFFGCDNLANVIIPDSIVSIGNYAFAFCSSLTTVAIPNSVSSIGHSAFTSCTSLTSVIIPDNATSIGDDTFSGCTSLTSVTIPNSVTTIGNNAFYNCASLTSVYCKAITPPTLTNSFDSIPETAKIYVPAESVNSYKRAEGWKEFADCIVGYDFENGVVVPGQPNNEIWYTATTQIYPYNSDVFGANLISNEWDAETGKGVLQFDGDVTMIGENGFFKCASLTSVAIPNSVTKIGNNAFQGCTSLTSVIISDSVTSIGESTFRNSFSLTNITIPNSVRKIGKDAFYNCTSLTSVTIPDGVTEMGQGVFEGSSSLKEVYCKPTTPPVSGGYNMFSYYSNYYRPIGCKIYVPRASVDAYKAAQYWSDYVAYIEPYDFE